MRLSLTTAVLTISLFTSSAFGHDITMYPIKTGKSVKFDMFFGDPGEYIEINSDRFIEVNTHDKNDQQIEFIRMLQKDEKDNRRIWTEELKLGDSAGGTYVLASRYDNGYMLRDLEDRHYRTTLEVWGKEVSRSKWLLRFAKTLFYINEPSEGFDRVIGHLVEFIPKKNPFTLKKGEELPVQLLIDGKPKPNHKVHIGDETSVQIGPDVYTDENGIITVKLDRNGYYRLAADYITPAKYPTLSTIDEYTASLVFEH